MYLTVKHVLESKNVILKRDVGCCLGEKECLYVEGGPLLKEP